MGSVTSIEAGERGAGGCLVEGTTWLGIPWQMNWLNNLANLVEAIGAIPGMTLVCCCSSEVTVGLVYKVPNPYASTLWELYFISDPPWSCCVSCCCMPCCTGSSDW